LAAVLVLAVAVPALAGGGSVFNLAKHANRSAKRALHRSSRALHRGSRALERGHHAIVTAGTAQATANGTAAEIDTTRVASATAPGQVSTNNNLGDYANLGGPSVHLTVPSSGLIEVWAQAEIKDDNGGAVALFEDGKPVTGGTDADFCGTNDALFLMTGGGSGSFGAFGTPANPSFIGCTAAGAPAAVIFQRTPGPHTYDLRYSDCGCGGGGVFRNRVLRVAGRL